MLNNLNSFQTLCRVKLVSRGCQLDRPGVAMVSCLDEKTETEPTAFRADRKRYCAFARRQETQSNPMKIGSLRTLWWRMASHSLWFSHWLCSFSSTHWNPDIVFWYRLQGGVSISQRVHLRRRFCPSKYLYRIHTKRLRTNLTAPLGAFVSLRSAGHKISRGGCKETP